MSKIIPAWKFEGCKAIRTFFIGKDKECVDSLWYFYGGEFLPSQLVSETLENIPLFSSSLYRSDFNNDLLSFLKNSDYENYSGNISFRNLTIIQAKNLAQEKDEIIDCDLPENKLAEFLKLQSKLRSWDWTDAEFKIATMIGNNLFDFERIYKLKSYEIDPENWYKFLIGKNKVQNWYQEYKKGELISNGIFEKEIFGRLKYIQKASNNNEEKSLAYFIENLILNDYSTWENMKLLEKLVR